MPRTETPPPFQRGKARNSSALRDISRAAAGPHARVRLRARENEKTVLAMTLSYQSRFLAEGSRLFIPPPVFARCRGSFLADWSLEDAPFALKIAYVIEDGGF